MKIWLDRILAALRWAGEKLVAFAKVAFAKIQVIFNTVYDPPPRTIRFWFWSAFGLVACVWITFAFVNSWFYKPAVQALAEFSYVLSGDDGDVALPEMEDLPPVAAVAVPEVSAQEVVCLDASDTPQCLPSEEKTEGKELTSIPEKEVTPPPVAKPATPIRKSRKVRKVSKHQPYQTYWGF
jgi:hypothetical protein